MSAALVQRGLDELVLRLEGLVAARSLLARRGASPAELRVHNEEIAHTRDELAQRAKSA